MKPTARPLPAAVFLVMYLDGTAGWTPTNLGRFATRDEAAAASLNWKIGFARTHGGLKPPVRVVAAPAVA